jgi:hypothetical protein
MSTQPPGPDPNEPEPGATAFVWGIWGLSTLAAVTFVAHFGSNVPVWDDYSIVPQLAGHLPVTPAWLWEQCNEHRIVLPKLILLSADHLGHNDVRAGMFLSVAALSGLAASLIALAAHLPGRQRTADALFPLLLLSLGQAANLIWSHQFLHSLSIALGTAYLIPMVARSAWPGYSTLLAAGIGMALLPLCGGTGLMYVPGLEFWMLGMAVASAYTNHPDRWRRAGLVVLSMLPGLAVTALYFRGFHQGLHPEAPGGVLDALRAALQFLAGGIGLPASVLWPWSGWLTLGLIVLSIAFLTRSWICQPDQRPRVFGLSSFLMSMLAIAGAVGWGRGWAGDMAGFQDRYVTMAIPLWCWFAFVFRVCMPPSVGRLSQYSLFTIVCACVWPNTAGALQHGHEVSTQVKALSSDILAGTPEYQIIKKYTPFLHPSQDELARFLPMMRQGKLGPFAALRQSPPFRSISLPPRPTQISLARWEGNTAHITGVDPQLIYTLSPPRMIAGIRVRYAHKNLQGADARFSLSWKRPAQAAYNDQQRYANWTLPTGEGRETTIWIDDVVEQFRIQPDNQRGEFRIDEITLLVL